MASCKTFMLALEFMDLQSMLTIIIPIAAKACLAVDLRDDFMS